MLHNPADFGTSEEAKAMLKKAVADRTASGWMEPARSIAVASRFTLSKPSGANALVGGEPNFCLYASLNIFMPGESTPRKRCVVKTMFLMPFLLETPLFLRRPAVPR